MKKVLMIVFSLFLLGMTGCTNVEKINKELNIQTVENHKNVKIPNWKIVEIVDKFQETTDKTRIITYSIGGKNSLWIETGEPKWNNSYMITFISDEFLGGKGIYNKTTISIKIDDNKPITIYNAYVSSANPYDAYTYDSKEIIKQMLHGKKMKVSIERYDNRNVFMEFDLTHFSEAIRYVL